MLTPIAPIFDDLKRLIFTPIPLATFVNYNFSLMTVGSYSAIGRIGCVSEPEHISDHRQNVRHHVQHGGTCKALHRPAHWPLFFDSQLSFWNLTGVAVALSGIFSYSYLVTFLK